MKPLRHEKVVANASRARAGRESLLIMCECWHPECSRWLRVPAEVVLMARRRPGRFIVLPAPEHVASQTELAVEQLPDWWIVDSSERSDGDAAPHDQA